MKTGLRLRSFREWGGRSSWKFEIDEDDLSSHTKPFDCDLIPRSNKVKELIEVAYGSLSLPH